jgi:hypothetical protein
MQPAAGAQAGACLACSRRVGDIIILSSDDGPPYRVCSFPPCGSAHYDTPTASRTWIFLCFRGSRARKTTIHRAETHGTHKFTALSSSRKQSSKKSHDCAVINHQPVRAVGSAGVYSLFVLWENTSSSTVDWRCGVARSVGSPGSKISFAYVLRSVHS